MEKTLTIDGKQVRFKSTAATPLRFKAQFGKDFFAEVFKLYPLTKLNLESKEIDYEVFKSLDFEVFYNILWAMAKTADQTTPDPITWLDGFEEFPLFEILPEVQDLIMKNLQSKKK